MFGLGSRDKYVACYMKIEGKELFATDEIGNRLTSSSGFD
jgi:hypothetical protein